VSLGVPGKCTHTQQVQRRHSFGFALLATQKREKKAAKENSLG
jgi:hypothetical protein